jgi:predicted ATP-grasp superfamily ATP-dependent carboligase
VLAEFVCDHRSEIEGRFTLLMPKDEVVRALIDKREETAWVTQLGFALPASIPLPSTAEELLDCIPLPIMVKLRKHAYWRALNRKNVILRSREQVGRFYGETGHFASFLIAQELIEAADTDSWLCNAVLDRQSRLASACIKRKVRMTPAHFGVATIALSAWNREILDLVERMATAIRLVGLASFEFRFDPRNGVYQYI